MTPVRRVLFVAFGPISIILSCARRLRLRYSDETHPDATHPNGLGTASLFLGIVLALGLLTSAGSLSSVVSAHDGHDHSENGHQHAGQAGKPAPMTTRSGAKVLAPTKEKDVFHFVVYGDRTGGVPEGLKVLEQAVVDTNLIDPDLVMTVGDLIQGYNETPEWMDQMREYKAIMDELRMPWFPVAGNHDIYWRGPTPPPQGHHEANYEKHFGPLWYSFRHKNAGFIVLYSDEGDPETNRKAFNSGKLQMMSDEQLAFLDKALEELKDAEHVFAFLHHPRWVGRGYTGSNWDVVHKRLADAGNVSAVFAGHIHQMRYDGKKDGIEYYALATTGGGLSAEIPGAGLLHHFNIVTVRESGISVSTVPVGAVIDPKDFTPELVDDVGVARSIRPRLQGKPVVISADGSASGTVTMEIKNPCKRDIELRVSLDPRSLKSGWASTLDGKSRVIPAGGSIEVSFDIRHAADNPVGIVMPQLQTELDYLTEDARIRLPENLTLLRLTPDRLPVDYFTAAANQYLVVDGDKSALRVPSELLKLPSGPMTLEGWVRMDELAGFRGVIAKTESSEFSIFSDEGALTFDVHLDGRYVSARTEIKLTKGRWTHVAGVYDGQQLRLYIDGKRVAENRAGRRRRTNDLPLVIGGDPDRGGNATRSMKGGIDEVRLSKTARYVEDFEPADRFEPDGDTVLLLHLDRTLGPFTLDHSESSATAILGEKSKLMPR